MVGLIAKIKAAKMMLILGAALASVLVGGWYYIGNLQQEITDEKIAKALLLQQNELLDQESNNYQAAAEFSIENWSALSDELNVINAAVNKRKGKIYEANFVNDFEFNVQTNPDGFRDNIVNRLNGVLSEVSQASNYNKTHDGSMQPPIKPSRDN